LTGESPTVAEAPNHPKIYHITHVRNLPQIVQSGVLWSDAKRIELGLQCDVVGMSHIKQRRLREIEVECHAGTHVGDYVPFYFCPRSIMLYMLHKGNHPELNYRGGQEPIIHLQADMKAVVAWADQEHQRWAFSTSNAGARYVNFFHSLNDLDNLNWTAIGADQWSDVNLKEGKQAEFLVHGSFPWQAIERVGVCNERIAEQVRRALASADHQPGVAVQPGWYY
jgi:hypothetical protein